MAGTQPANTDISVFRNVRSFRQAHRHESVAALIKRLRPLVVSVPAEEILVSYQNRDTTKTDFSAYMGEASHTATRGFPRVIGLVAVRTFASVAGTASKNFDFPFQIGSDKFLALTSTGLTHATNHDLHASVRAVTGVTDTHI
jgi:hypothetical protein